MHFLAPKAIGTLMDQLMEILNADKEKELNEKQKQMVELIIVLLKQLLQIPEVPSLMVRGEKSLQKRLLHMYSEENVLDLFVFMTQDFEDPLHKKLTLHFLEIQYQIIKGFTPKQIINR